MPIATNYAAPVTELLAATTACLHKSCAADAHERAPRRDRQTHACLTFE
jgi:hypothetical protein